MADAMRRAPPSRSNLSRGRRQPQGVELLVALGIPRLLFDRLDPPPVDGRGAWPTPALRCVNVADRQDVVALRKQLAPLFRPSPAGAAVVDWLADNGTGRMRRRVTSIAGRRGRRSVPASPAPEGRPACGVAGRHWPLRPPDQWEELDQAKTALATVADCLEGLGYRPAATARYLLNPTKDELGSLFRSAPVHAGVAIAYYTGHGHVDGLHYLATRNATVRAPKFITGSAIASRELRRCWRCAIAAPAARTARSSTC